MSKKKLTEKEVLELVDDGSVDAFDLLLEHQPGAYDAFHKAADALNKVLVTVRKSFPDATYYSASGSLCLLLGNSHSHASERPQQQLLVTQAVKPTIEGGDW